MFENELLEVVDKNDKVIGIEKRGVIHKKHLYHRAIQTLIFNKNKKLFLQQRGYNKEIYPGLYGFSVGGHVKIKETYEDAAIREIKEEIKIKINKKNLIFIKKFRPCRKNTYEFTKVYVIKNITKKPRINKKEVNSGFFISINDLKKMIKQKPNMFCPDFIMVMNYIFKNKILDKVLPLHV